MSRRWTRLAGPLLVLAGLSGVALAQPPDEAREAPVQEPLYDRAPVVIDGITLFEVNGIRAFPAARRAETIQRAILEVAADPSFDPAQISSEEGDRETRVLAGRRRIARVADTDGEIEGVARKFMAEVWEGAIRKAIVDYRAARTSEALTASAWRAGAATLVALAALILLARGNRRLHRALEERYRDRVRAVTSRSFEVVRAERLWKLLRGASHFAGGILLLVIAYIYLRYVLGLLPWTRGAAPRLEEWLLAPLTVLGKGLVHQIPNLVFLLVLFFIVRWSLGLVRLFFASVGRGEVVLSGFDAEWADPTYKLVRFATVAFAVVVAYPYVPGSSSDAFKGISLFAGIVFSLGSSSAIANVLAGYSLTYRRAFRVGDRIRIADTVGDVSRIRLQATYLRTVKNEEVVIPNSKILNGEVINYSTLARTAGLVLHTTVGIGYETSWRQVEAMLLDAARRTAGLRAEPQPFVLQLALGDFAVTYEINVFCDNANAMAIVYTELHRNILDVFNENGVQIMTPAYVSDPEQPKIVPKEQWHLPPATKP